MGIYWGMFHNEAFPLFYCGQIIFCGKLNASEVISGAFQTFFKLIHSGITDSIPRVVRPFIQCLKIKNKL